MGTTIRNLAGLAPQVLVLMHGPAFRGNAAQALLDLGDAYDRRALAAMQLAGFEKMTGV